VTVSPADLATYLGAEVDATRAQYLLDRATDLCLSIASPLPAGADAVVLDVAARAFTNPGNVASQGVGPFNASYGPTGGGLWLTRQNKATLRRLAGGSSAYSIDPTPADVLDGTRTQALPFWAWDPAAYKAANPGPAVTDNGDGTFTVA
jgi:hypothetical protein